MMSAAKNRASGLFGGQEFDDAEPVLLILPSRNRLFALFPTSPDPFPGVLVQKLAIHRRYTERRFLGIPYCHLQGISVRPVPCNYNVIQHISVLSRR